MGRQRRSDRQHGYFHVLNRGVDHQATFFDDADRVGFGRVLAETAIDHAIEIHAYCLMPNHYHLVVNSPTGTLSDFMQRLIAIHTRRTNERWGRDGPLYRGRFKSLVIDDDSYLLTAVRYVHRNPLSLPDCRGVDGYRWSSHRVYLGYRRGQPWLRTDVVFGLLGDDVDRYRAFIDEDDGRRFGLSAAVELAIEEHSDRLERSLNGLAKTISLHLVATGQLGEDQLREVGAVFSADRYRRDAMVRATRLVSSDRVLASIASRTARLAA